jgi:hypothetical protein
MQSKEFQEVVKRAKEVNGIIEKLDPSIRAEVFAMVKSYITGPTNGETRKKPDGTPQHLIDVADAEAFFTKHADGKPADNVLLIAAYLYGQYGSEPFGLEEIRNVADGSGVTIPARPDMTIRAARRSGKKLFQRVGANQYKPTVHGESHFKTTYSVKKGSKSKPSADQ